MLIYTHQFEGLSFSENIEFGGVSVAVKYEGPLDQGITVRMTKRISFKEFLISKHSLTCALLSGSSRRGMGFQC